ncbi:hypothetical protein [Actinoplanes sp. N902-109]|uniref:hypothetical protein n=1 Tax=Actinoplanes sp. (strain N902-109) TaxID=649831 RepID=UPI0003295D31|nr:hypothetical protein [Actinoplanes sp. N902-109]AGL14771.1 cell wall anchor domain-containing protein [Actinoplanes sp. N902-109]
MQRVSIGRVLTVAVAAVVPALTGATAAQAHGSAAAQVQRAEPLHIELIVPGVSIPVGDNGTPITPRLVTTATGPVNAGTVTYDWTGPGVLSLPDKSPCTVRSPEKIECATPFTYVYPDYLNNLPGVIAKATQPSSTTGSLKVTFAAAGAPALTRTVGVRTADAVDLAAGASTSGSVAFGRSVEIPARVRNQGDEVVHGAAVLVTYRSPFQFKAPRTYTNCSYAGGLLVSCRFDRDLAAGTSYQTRIPYAVSPTALSPTPGFRDVQLVWMTTAELADQGELGTPGTGTELTLDEMAQTLADPQADEDKSNNTSYVDLEVTGQKNGVDFAAVGDQVSGRKGDVVTATVGFRNLGPAGYNAWDVVQSAFTVPPGTTVVDGVPEGCLSQDADGMWQPDQPGKTFYSCTVDAVLGVGDRVTFDFHLRIDKVIAGAKGTFLAGGGPCQRECPIFQADINLRNQQATVVVNPKAKPPTGDDNGNGPGNGTGGNGGGDGGNGGGSGGSGGGSGGGLPVTGPTSALIAGAGVVLIGGGALLLLTTRRRRSDADLQP